MSEALLAVPLVGRQPYLESFQAWVADLRDGRGRAVLVEGEPGIGKSSILRSAAADAEPLGVQVFWGACDELSQAFPLLPLLDAIGAAGGESQAKTGEGPAKIAELLRADSSPSNTVDLVAAATERLLALVDELCTAAPVLLVVDDLQWADPATVMTLGRLARSVRQLPLLVVGTTRPVPRRDDLNALRRAVEPDGFLRLGNLTEDEVADFVAHAVGGVPGPRLMRLAAGAAGNPLYLSELIDALVRGHALVASEGCVEATGARTPVSLSAAIADRLEFLSAPVRGVLRAAALLGTDFSVSDLSVVSGVRINDLVPLLDEAMLTGVLRGDGRQLAFRHPLIRAALYDGMPVAVRAAWHRDAARALAENGASAERVARQLVPALDPNDTSAIDDWLVSWLAGAGQQLLGQAPHVAIPLLRWALTGIPNGVPPHDLLSCRLADALFRVGDPAGAARVASAALAHVTRSDLLVDLHWTLAQCRARDGRSEESLTALQRTLDSPDIEPKHRARLLVLSARAHRGLGRVEKAGSLAEQALEAATRSGDRWATAWALGVRTIVHGMRGEAEAALPLFQRAIAVTEGDPALADLRLCLQINQAVALSDLDRYDDAIVAAQQVRQQADEAGNVNRLAQAQSVLGELLFDVGRWDDALAEVDLVSGDAKDPVVECCDQGVAATIRLHRGDTEARSHLAGAEQYAARLGNRVVIGSLTLARSLDREQADEPDEALAVLVHALSDTAEEVEQTTELLADAVRLAVNLGDDATARTIVRRAEEVALSSTVPHHQAIGPHCRGLLDADPDRLLTAADHYREAGRPLPRAQALEAAGVVLADRGDIAGARTHFSDAFSLYSRLGAGWDLARTQARFRAYGIRRGPRVRHRRAHRGWGSLTPTELRIVALVAQGMSNPQIATHLFLSRRTVQTHVSHVLAKLDLHSRTDIAREASRRDLTGIEDTEAAE